MNTTKRSIVVSAILVIALCVSLVAGATFALFTSESSVNITVSSGTVNVVAEIDSASVQTKQLGSAYAAGADHMYGGAPDFTDGLSISHIVPGDGIKFDIKVTNNSTVAVKYRTIISCVSDDGLLDGLAITIDGESYAGSTIIAPFRTIDPAITNVASVPVSIELPDTAEQNAFQGKTLKLSYKVEAVQGNATTPVLDANTYYVYSASDLVALQSKTGVSRVEFINDIDMSGADWTGLKGGAITNKSVFAGSGVTFVGNGHSISNLPSALVAGTTYPVTFQNLTIKNNNTMAAVTDANAWSYNAAFVAYANTCSVTFKNCAVENVKLETAGTKYGGAFIAYFGGDETDGYTLTIDGCSLNNSKVVANGSTGGFAGHVSAQNTVIKNSSVTGSTVAATDDSWRVGSVIGTIQTAATFDNVTSTSNTIEMWDVNNPTQQLAGRPSHETFGRIVAPGSLIVGGAHYVTHAAFAKLLEQGTTAAGITLEHDYYLVDSSNAQALVFTNDNYFTVDGNGHTIYGLTRPLINSVGDITISIKNLTISGAHIESTTEQSNNLGTAAFVGYVDLQSNSITLEGCKLVDSHVEGTQSGARTAAFIGHVSGGSVTVKDCVVDKCTIKSVDGAAGIICNTYATTSIDGCKVLGNTSITSTEVRSLDANSGILVGSVQPSSVTTIANITVASTVTLTHGGTNAYHLYVGRVIAGGTCTIA